jgi:hypothetical protein
MKSKRGRPKLPKGESKGVLFAVRVSTPEAQQIHGAIKRSGLSKPDWHRRALLTAAEM